MSNRQVLFYVAVKIAFAIAALTWLTPQLFGLGQ